MPTTLLSLGRQPLFSELQSSAPTQAYVFGTSGNVTSVADLLNNFDPLESGTGSTVINNEIQRYPAAFDPTLFTFSSNQMAMNVVAPNGWGTVVSSLTTAAMTGGSVIPVVNGALFSVGQMIAVQYNQQGYTYVKSIAGNNVTVNSPVYCGSGNLIYGLPVMCVATASASSGVTITTSDPVPAGVAAGMYYDNVSTGAYGIVKVVSKTSNTITFDTALAVGASNFMMLIPPVYAAQIWSKFIVAPPALGRVVAMELEAQIPPSTALGNWPAWWMYSKNAGLGYDSSEIDMFEFFQSDTSPNAFTGYCHGPFAGQAPNYRRPDGTWDQYDYYRRAAPFNFSSAMRKWGLRWLPDRVQRYLDNELISETQYKWTSLSPAQIGLNIAAGSMASAFMGNGMFPRNAGQFPYSMNVRGLKIWQ